MRGERPFVFAALLATAALSGCVADLGSASPHSIELSRGPMRELPVVLPPPTSAAVVEKDTAEAEAETRRRAIERVRPAPPRRPDLDLDVTLGIQSRNLNRALGR